MISVVIITKNEEANIARCLKSVLPISDNIIVLDSGSTDQTVSIAMEHGVKIISTEWKGYGATKNFGHDQCQYDWILSIDADEAVSPELQNSINSISLQSDQVYSVRRINYYCGGAMKFGHLKPEWKIRLFNRLSTKWDNRIVHEKLLFASTATTQKLEGGLDHRICYSRTEFESRCTQFAQLGAVEWSRIGYKPSYVKRNFGHVYHFFKSYFLQMGLVEASNGYDVSKIVARAFRIKIKFFLNRTN